MKQTYYKRKKWKFIPQGVVSSLVSEILDVAKNNLKTPVNKLKVLDVGSGNGEYVLEISRHVSKVIGVEPYGYAFNNSLRMQRISKVNNVKYYKCAVENFNTHIKFDLILSLTTIEHMPNGEKSFDKIFNLLKPGGIIYITAPNKLWPFEHHYRLFFLSWLPLPLSNIYVRLTGRGGSYEDSSYSKTYFGMKKLFDRYPCSYKFQLPKNTNSNYIGCGEKSLSYTVIKKIGMFLIKNINFFWIFSKGFIVVVKKNE